MKKAFVVTIIENYGVVLKNKKINL